MGTSSSEGEGDYLMPWSRVLNWNRLPGELSSSLSLSPLLFSTPVHPLRIFFLPPSLRLCLPCLLSLFFFFLHLSIYYRPSSVLLLLLAFFVRFLGGAERSLIADGRTSRPRDRIGNEGQKFADPPLYTGFRGRGRGKKARGGEGKKERERDSVACN